ncbi:MAG: SUMF1/EgtB/PvdO family nonheme iron enzyme [Anaerolineales bacterium]|nr:SUMF1/EgtB/PvdO family nonheme iron enzyme [Anaerolineales bacterium]
MPGRVCLPGGVGCRRLPGGCRRDGPGPPRGGRGAPGAAASPARPLPAACRAARCRFQPGAGGYDKLELWSAEGRAWRQGKYDSRAPEESRPWLEIRPPDQRGEPFYWHDSKWNNPLAPVVGVCWFEAQAYCNWLAGELDRPIRLPSEQEWERAARGLDAREYPWGDDFDRARLNCAEFWSGERDLSDVSRWLEWLESDSYKQASTSAVIQFPEGSSPDGLMDMGGNVWEWTCSLYEGYPNKPRPGSEDLPASASRVLRGGSWCYVRGFARAVQRNSSDPNYSYVNYGFRVVVASGRELLNF